MQPKFFFICILLLNTLQPITRTTQKSSIARLTFYTKLAKPFTKDLTTNQTARNDTRHKGTKRNHTPRRAFNPYHKRINETKNHIAVYSARGRFNARTTAKRDIGNLETKPGATKREVNQGEKTHGQIN